MAKQINLRQHVCDFTGQKSDPFPVDEGMPEGWATVVIRRGGMSGTYFLSPNALASSIPGVLTRFEEEVAAHHAQHAAPPKATKD